MRPSGLAVVVAIGLGLAVACAPAAAPAAKPAPAAPAAVTSGSVPGAPSGPAPAAGALKPEIQQLVDGARQEGPLTLVWSANTLGGAQGAQRIVDALNKRYGLNVRVTFTPGPAMPDMAVRLAQEQAAGRAATSDVYIGTEAQIKDLLHNGGLVATDWVGLSDGWILPTLLAPDGIGVEFATRVPGVTYNTQIVSADRAPRVTADLLKPEWKGKLASTPYGALFDILGSPELWGPERTLAFTRELTGNLAGLMRCGETERLISGEFHALIFDCGDYEAREWQAKGAPIGHAIMRDAFALQYWWMGVPQNAAHPNAATLFVLEVLSREGQEIVWEEARTDQWKLPGSRVAPIIRDLEREGVKIVEGNVPFLLSYPEQPQVRRQVQETLAQARR